jgi:hypothetical protein
MADAKISQLTGATTPLAGTEVVPVVQSGATKKVSIDNLTAGKTVACATMNIDANTSSAALRVTQTGAGNALLVEDSASPDSSPFVVNNAGNVGFGITNPGYLIDAQGSSATARIAESGGGEMRVTVTGSTGRVGTYSNHPLLLMTNGTEKARVDTSGNLTIGDGNVIIGTSGKGIDFSATGQATGMTSELLDDYEEGAYTATLTPSTSGSITLDAALDTLSYTKIGRVVHVFGLVLVSSVASPVGRIRVNLPTTIASTNLYSTRTSGNVTCTAVAAANVANFVVLAVEGNAYFEIGLGDATTIQNDAAQEMQSNSQISVTFSYISA